jgi:hypothetical protein
MIDKWTVKGAAKKDGTVLSIELKNHAESLENLLFK